MSSPDATQGKNVQQKQEKSKNEWLLQDHSRVVGKPEVIIPRTVLAEQRCRRKAIHSAAPPRLIGLADA
jgi:hypothetical protein